MKLKVLLYSLILSVTLIIFPVASGVIIALNNIDVPNSYWVQGVMMLLSTTIPITFLLISSKHPSQIGFIKINKKNFKILLYFIPLIVTKIGFLFFGINYNNKSIIALMFFTATIGLSEEIYFRGIILNCLKKHFSIKQTILLSAAFFAIIHTSQAFSGEGFVMVILSIINAFIFGIIAAEIVIFTGGLIPVILWHTSYNFINWVTLAQGRSETILIIIESIIMISYGVYLWTKIPSINHFKKIKNND